MSQLPINPATRRDPLPTSEDVGRHCRRLRIDGKTATAWMIERLALEAGIMIPNPGVRYREHA